MAASAEIMDLTTSAVEGWMAPPMAIQKGENRGFIEVFKPYCRVQFDGLKFHSFHWKPQILSQTHVFLTNNTTLSWVSFASQVNKR